ncbi:helix-turn-helix domain-containing protein [Mycobacterium colombiense]|uniref:Helix-turn-helix domain-containing protein n=1 Tax=Mycobacterium colombiense TaxID=339268 RepID=A0A1A2ZBY7_9MYCO|nr:helix-turn-helix domain-containing protein [Mycobacterium colombiense]OBI46982.1 hypothetical protein A5708_12095 [Mycobacterium colombiense]
MKTLVCNEYVNGTQAAEILGKTRRTIGNMIRDGRLPAHRIGNSRELYIRRADIEAALTPIPADADVDAMR